jgi:ParB-like chromosome segregation protein Spo0J
MKVPINKVKTNPDNPRVIKDEKFKKLVKSIKDFPEMADIRPIVVNKEYMILGGNMRYRAMKEAGWKEVPIVVADLTPEKQKEFVIKDNIAGGEWEWDMIANEWSFAEIEEWGLDLPDYLNEDLDNAGDDIKEEDGLTVKITFKSQTQLEGFVKEVKTLADEFEGNISVNST